MDWRSESDIEKYISLVVFAAVYTTISGCADEGGEGPRSGQVANRELGRKSVEQLLDKDYFKCVIQPLRAFSEREFELQYILKRIVYKLITAKLVAQNGFLKGRIDAKSRK